MKRISLFTGIALLLLSSCTPKKEKKEADEKFAVTNPVRMDTSFTKEFVTQIRSIRNIELRAQEKGFLQNIYVDEGQFVQAGFAGPLVATTGSIVFGRQFSNGNYILTITPTRSGTAVPAVTSGTATVTVSGADFTGGSGTSYNWIAVGL